MVTNKKAQGLSLNLIVIAAIAALVLVLIIAFTIGGFGTFFSKIFGAGKATVGDETDVVRTTCSGLCDTAKSSLTTNAWSASSYCSRTFNVDKNNDGILNGTEGELNLHCWNTTIGISCSTNIGGTTVSEKNCTGY